MKMTQNQLFVCFARLMFDNYLHIIFLFASLTLSAPEQPYNKNAISAFDRATHNVKLLTHLMPN